MEDAFIREHIEDLLRNIRTQVILGDITFDVCIAYLLDHIFTSDSFLILISKLLPKVLIKLIKPYTRIQIKFISGELNIESGDVESLLVSCILDNTISGRIDQVPNLQCKTNSVHDVLPKRYLEFWSLTKVARVRRDTWPSTSGTTS